VKKLKIGLVSTAIALSMIAPTAHAAADPLLGEIMWVPYNFCPRGWANADGQLLAISEHSALFSLLGTVYGGDGRTSFGLPDLRGRTAVHVGTGPGLSSYALGQKAGQEKVTLTTTQMPTHNHSVNASEGRSGKNANGSILGSGARVYDAPIAASTQLDTTAIAPTGSSQPHENRPPYLVLRACIALQGIFPSAS